MALGNDTTFVAALVILFGLLLAWLTLARRPVRWARAHPVAAIVIAAVVTRAVPAVVLNRGLPFDIEAHWWVGLIVLAGQNVYSAPYAVGRYPYPPLHGYISAFLVQLSGQDHGVFLVVDKLLPAAFGTALSVVVWAAARRLGRSPHQALVAGLLYALNPLAMLVTGYHGQFEEIPLLFIGLALLLLIGERPGWTALAASALLLGVGVAYKTWPLLFLPPLLLLLPRGWRRRVVYMPLTLVPLAVSIVLYARAFEFADPAAALHRLQGYPGSSPLHKLILFVKGETVLHSLLNYKGSNGFCWGYVGVVHQCWVHPDAKRLNPWVLGVNSTLLLVALALAMLLLLGRRRPLEGMVALPLAFYLFSPGWGPDYAVWVLPFAALFSATVAWRYTLVMLPLVALTYLDSLYAAFFHSDMSWLMLKPIEALLGLAAWVGVAILLVQVYLSAHRLPWFLPVPPSPRRLRGRPARAVRDAAVLGYESATAEELAR